MAWVKTAFHKMGSPRWFYHGAGGWVLWLYILGIALIVVGTTWGLGFAPTERFQGDSFRVMYVHVPAAHLAQMIYIAAAVAGAVFLIWRMKMADVFIVAAAPIGVAMTVLALFTGVVWGMPTWGTGWVWDARTTSVLALLFLFFGLVALRQAIARPERAAFAVSILALVGVINIPIIKYSVEWFTTLHQPASFELGKPVAVDTAMLWPLAINALGFYLFTAGTILAAMRLEVLRRERSSQWVREAIGVSNS